MRNVLAVLLALSLMSVSAGDMDAKVSLEQRASPFRPALHMNYIWLEQPPQSSAAVPQHLFPTILPHSRRLADVALLLHFHSHLRSSRQ